MTTPITPVHHNKPHPLIIAAAVAVLLFCLVGIASFMGWLPSSLGNKHDGAVSASEQAAVDQSAPANIAANNAPSGNTTMLAANAPVDNGPPPAPVPVSETAPPPPHVCNNCGVVESVHEVTTRASGSGVGAAGGAVVGGLLGNQVGSGNGRSLATIAGAIGGAVAGNQIEGNMKTTHSWNIVVRMDNGKTRTLSQSSQPQWRSGDAVRVVNGQLRSID